MATASRATISLATVICVAGCASGGGGGGPSYAEPSLGSSEASLPAECAPFAGFALLACYANYLQRTSGSLPSVFAAWSSPNLNMDSNRLSFLVPGSAITLAYTRSPLSITSTSLTAQRVNLIVDYDSSSKNLVSLGLWFSGDSPKLPGDPTIEVLKISASLPYPPLGGGFLGSAPNGVAIVANPFALGWDYQSFGAWNDAPTASISSVSFGAETPASALPLSGTGNFAGKLGGFYLSPAGESALASADVTVNVDFSARTLGFTSHDTHLTQPVSGAAVTSVPQLNLSGALSYAPLSSSFSGTLTNAGNSMTGESSGRFYGPGAQELGGTFYLKSPTTLEAFAGAYGAKR